MKALLRLLPLFVFLFAVLFAFIGIQNLPLGMHYDQMRYIVAPEQQILGLFSRFSLRETVANLLLLGYQSAIVAEYARFVNNPQLLLLIPRIVTAIFFVLSSMVWYSITRELGLSAKARAFFTVVLLTGGLFLVYSKFLPMLGAYLFFISMFWYFLIRYENTNFSTSHLILAGVFAVFSLYTHAMAVFVVGFSLIAWFSKYIFVKSKRIILLNNLPKKEWLIFAIALFSLLLFPLFSTLVTPDPNISGKDEFTIFYLLKHGEFKYAAETAGIRLVTYVNPQFLVAGGPMAGASTSTDLYTTANIKNPEANAFLLTNISPFGYVTLALFLAFPFYILSNKSVAASFWRFLVLVYLLSAIIPNFDNPSLARLLPLYLLIPLGLAIIWDEVEREKKLKRNILTTLLLILLIASSAGNLFAVYGFPYKKSDSKKFDTLIVQALPFMLGNELASKEVVLDNKAWNSQNTLQYLFSPYIVENTIKANGIETISPEILSKRTIFTNTLPNNEITRERKVLSFSNEFSSDSLYVVYDSAINACRAYPTSQTVYIEKTVTPQFKGNEEFLQVGYEYRESIDKNWLRVNDRKTAEYAFISPTKDDLLKLPMLTEKVLNDSDFVVSNNGKRKNDHNYEFTIKQQPESLVVYFRQIPKGTYRTTFTVRTNDTATFDAVLLDGADSRLPYIDQKIGNAYSYVFSVTDTSDVRLILGGYFTSYLLDSEKHFGTLSVENTKLFTISNEVLVNVPRANLPGEAKSPLTVSLAKKSNSYEISAPDSSLGDDMIVSCPILYSPWINVKTSSGEIENPIRVNGNGVGVHVSSGETASLEFSFPLGFMLLGGLYVTMLMTHTFLIAIRPLPQNRD